MNQNLFPKIWINREKDLGGNVYRSYWPKNPAVIVGHKVIAIDSDAYWYGKGTVVHIEDGCAYVQIG